MRLLLITHAVFLDPCRINAGNSVRGYFLSKGLLASGHSVVFAYPRELERFSSGEAREPEPGLRVASFGDARELAALIGEVRPDALLVGYWELTELLPEALDVPVILDVVAPRVLEAMFQSDRALEGEVRRMLAAYRRADRFLVGTERQRHFLLPWLVMAGFDCRFDVPIDVIPISTEASSRDPIPAAGRTRFVSGGVSWPWRRTERWFDEIVATLRAHPDEGARFCLFAGEYIYGGSGDGRAKAAAGGQPAASVLESSGLLAYRDMQDFLETQCDVGVELADRNVEREYSQSFRAMEFLRAGLPLVCNDYLEIAGSVREFEAGWTVSSPQELPALVRAIVGDPAERARRGRNALALVNERFDYRVTIRPLVEYLRDPRIPAKGPSLFGSPAGSVVPKAEAALPLAGGGPLGRLKRAVARRGVGLVRSALSSRQAGRPLAGSVVMVSRQDVFPADHGAAVKIDRTAAALSTFVDAVFLVTDDRRHYHIYRNGVLHRERFPWWLSWIAPPRPWVRRLAAARGIPAGDAFLYYALFDWSYVLRTAYLGARHRVSLFQAEFPAYARACIWGRSLFGGKVALVEHNVEYQRLRDQTESLTEAGLAFLRDNELALCQQSDLVVAVSERDRRQLIADGVEASRVHYVPHGVDLRAFDAASPDDLRSRYRFDPDTVLLVYHGTYLYPPNLEAIRVLAERVMPGLRARGIRAKVLAIGNNPPQEAMDEDIVFTGSVPSVAPYLLAADIAVVPLLKGGGTRMKILDYFAARLPVVSSEKGIEGIPVRDGVHARIVPEVDDRFVDAIAQLVQNRQQAREIGGNGRAYVETLGWTEIARRYLALAGLEPAPGR